MGFLAPTRGKLDRADLAAQCDATPAGIDLTALRRRVRYRDDGLAEQPAERGISIDDVLRSGTRGSTPPDSATTMTYDVSAAVGLGLGAITSSLEGLDTFGEYEGRVDTGTWMDVAFFPPACRARS